MHRVVTLFVSSRLLMRTYSFSVMSPGLLRTDSDLFSSLTLCEHIQQSNVAQSKFEVRYSKSSLCFTHCLHNITCADSVA